MRIRYPDQAEIIDAYLGVQDIASQMRDLLTRFAPPSADCLLARLDGAPTGCVAFFDRGNATMEIKRMFVDPAARGHGIGGRMLDVDAGTGDGTPTRPSLDPSQHALGACGL